MRESIERSRETFESQTFTQPKTFTRFSFSSLSIKYRLPLLIGILLLGLILVFTWASYRSMRNTALEVGHADLDVGQPEDAHQVCTLLNRWFTSPS